ncbi:MAG: CoA transferase [Dehalococcoidia bacterium]|nr:MAG: CoA transferase [Dehalococcoidia bacterium]
MTALEGVRIADFCWLWAGAYATDLLAFLGAEVIKIESMARPDPSRNMTLTIGQAFEGVDHSPIFNAINLNKLSVRINLKQPQGVELAKRIIGISDVVSQNMRPGAMDNIGLGYDVLKELKPDIIMLSSSAFGSEGPLRRYGGYAPSFACYSGLAHLTGYSDGLPNPLTGSIDLMSATTSAFAIIAALNHRQHTGQGQYIDLSSVESLAIFAGDALMEYIMNGRVQSRNGNHDRIMAPHNCYRCKGEDKWVSIAVATDEEWRALCGAAGHPEWVNDERFADAYSRWENEKELDETISGWTINYTHYEVTEMLQNAGVAAMPSFSNEEIFSDPHFKERGLAVDVEHPAIGKQTVLGPPWRLSETPARVTKSAPLIGEHNDYVFKELLGMSGEEIERLTAEEIIY